ncbi:MAG: hypothetical protein AAFV53_01345 [Myxococcota bacterium]
MRTPALLAIILSGCGPKNAEDAPPPVGWHAEEGWTFECYAPPDYAQFNRTDRLMKRPEVLDQMLKQWTGGKTDAVAFEEERIFSLETVLLGRPEQIEAISQENYSRCVQVAGNNGSVNAWRDWVYSLPAKLTEGECLRPFDYTMFDYLEIGAGWQNSLSICQGDIIRISGTPKDRYRIEEGGPWINVAGDTARPAVGGEWPCNVEGCVAGQLILRFVSDAGVENIMPVGEELIYTAPEHGKISYRINDYTFFDNVWFEKRGLTDHTAIEITPMEAQ